MILILLVSIYYLIKGNIIHLDDNDHIININIDNIKFTITGQSLGNIVALIGHTAGFALGGKFGYAALAKYPVGLLSKSLGTAASAAGGAFTWKLTNEGVAYLHGKYFSTQLSDCSFNIEMKDITLSHKFNGSLPETTLRYLMDNKKINEPLLQKIKNAMESELVDGASELIKVTEEQTQPKIIELLECNNNKTITELFKSFSSDM